MQKRRRKQMMALLVASLLSTVAGAAPIEYYDSFTDYDLADGMPTDWTEARGEWALVGSDGSTVLQSSDSLANRTIYGDTDAASWGNYTARAVMIGYQGGTATPHVRIGLQARVQSTSRENYGVYLRSNGDLAIGRDGPKWSGPTTELPNKAGVVSAWNSSNGAAPIFLLEIGVDQESITGRGYTSTTYQHVGYLGDLKADTDPYATFTLEDEISVTDTNYSTGTIGLSLTHGGGNRFGRALHVEVEEIPEPGPLLIIGFGGAILFLRKLRTASL